MSSIDIFAMVIRNLYKRKLRTSLTIMGVVIGTASIVVMISLGLALTQTFNQQLETLGDLTTITVHRPWDDPFAKKKVKLDDNAVEGFKSMKGVITATPIVEVYMFAKSGKYINTNFRLLGIYPESMAPLGYAPAEGRLLTADDRLNIVFGSDMSMQFYKQGQNMYYGRGMMIQSVGNDGTAKPPINPLEDKIQASFDWAFVDDDYAKQLALYEADRPSMKPYTFKGVGVLSPKSWNENSAIFMSIDEVKKIKKARERYEQSQRQTWGMGIGGGREVDASYDLAYIKCTDLANVREVHKQVVEMGYNAEIPSQSLDSMEKISQTLQSLLGAIGAVSLFVAAIGIANTMITAIYERTREIGIMKVIGASIDDIKKMFLLEAAMIGFFGGILGVLLSLLISYTINKTGVTFFSSISEFREQTIVSLITPWLCGLAILFSTVMGLVSGYFPATRAMKLSALSAIRVD